MKVATINLMSHINLPRAVKLVVNTSIMISCDDGLVSTSEGFAGPPFSLKLYFTRLKFTVVAENTYT